jgi:nucleotide-binding universal stress UspA family protein
MTARHEEMTAMTMIAKTEGTARPSAAGRIAVGVDLGRGGLAALSWATEEAVASGARMTICHVRDHGDAAAAAPDLETLRLTQPGLVRRIRWCRQLLGGTNVAVELPLGDPAAALLELSGRADLLVIGGISGPDSHHRHPSLAAQIATRTRCPAVVVRPATGHDGAAFAGHVVIGVDGSPASAAAVRLGFSHARRHHLPVAAVYVNDRRPGGYRLDDPLPATHFAAEPAALTLLAREIEPVAARHPDVAVNRVVLGGDPITALRHAAAGAALLVLGRHSLPRPALLRPARVCRAFAEYASCVVAVVPEAWPPVRTNDPRRPDTTRAVWN